MTHLNSDVGNSNSWTLWLHTTELWQKLSICLVFSTKQHTAKMIK